MKESDYKKFEERKHLWYKTIKKVYCKATESDVIFNAKGFHHLLYDGKGSPRSIEERIRRLRLVEYAPTVIEEAEDVSWRRNTDKLEHLVFQKLIITDDDHKVVIRVIVNKTNTGNYIYHSVMDE